MQQHPQKYCPNAHERERERGQVAHKGAPQSLDKTSATTPTEVLPECRERERKRKRERERESERNKERGWGEQRTKARPKASTRQVQQHQQKHSPNAREREREHASEKEREREGAGELAGTLSAHLRAEEGHIFLDLIDVRSRRSGGPLCLQELHVLADIIQAAVKLSTDMVEGFEDLPAQACHVVGSHERAFQAADVALATTFHETTWRQLTRQRNPPHTGQA